MSKRITGRIIIIVSLIALIFIIAGFIKALKLTTGGAESVTESSTQGIKQQDKIKKSNTVNVFIVGDSIAKGTGDEKGKGGIGGYLPEILKNQTSKDIVIENAGIDGYKSLDLVEQVKSGKIDKAFTTSDIIIISIGGNDLREVQSLQGVEKENAFKEKQNDYTANLKEILKKIRSSNKTAVVISVGLYNPYGNQGAVDDARLVSLWNNNTQLIMETDERAVLVQTYSLFKFNSERFVSIDKLHPNSMGYQTIASLIGKSIEGMFGKASN